MGFSRKFRERVVHIVKTVASMQIPTQAASSTYFLVLALFPMLVLLMSLLRYTGLEVENLTYLLDGIIPEALLPAAERLIISTYAHTSGTMISLSALTALWSASRGVYGLLSGLNRIYGVEEERGFLYSRFVSFGYTFLFILVLILTLVLHVFGTTLLELLPTGDAPFWVFLSEVIDLRFFLLLFLQTAVFTAMYMFLPSGRRVVAESFPGALLASMGWLVLSDLFSLYVEYFPAYSNIYGSVYAVALGLLWLYMCVSIIFYGGALNQYLILIRKRAS